jgi:CIC family chloride channel protein
LRELRHEWQRILLLTALTGVVTGLAVAGFEGLTARLLLDWLFRAPLAAQVVIPAAGLCLAWVALATLGHGATPGTADEYIANFHDRRRPLPERPALSKVLASVATLGGGGAMGFEGPSIYMGSVIGSFFEQRFRRFFSREDAKLLMVAGAAAGVSAIFKTPATGAIFALEVPYQRDLAARSLLPALVASATSYLTFVAVWGTTPILAGHGSPGFDLPDVLGALAVGILAGLGARAFSVLIRAAKHTEPRLKPWQRLLIGGGGLAVLVGVGSVLFSDTLLLGPGYRAINWAADPRHGLVLVAVLFALRALATSLTVAGGGAGGLFIPLVVQGALLGRLVGDVAGVHTVSLFPLVGAAAFLGAGYRTPIAAVMFVAESTGRPGFVVPALLATVLAQLVMGRESVTTYQQPVRIGHLERRLGLPVRTALTTDVQTCSPTTPLKAVRNGQAQLANALAVPVIEHGQPVGIVPPDRFEDGSAEDGSALTAGDVMRTDVPVADTEWTLRRALAEMHAAGSDLLAVSENGKFVGVVTRREIIRLDEILDEIEDDE